MSGLRNHVGRPVPVGQWLPREGRFARRWTQRIDWLSLLCLAVIAACLSGAVWAAAGL